MNTYLLSFFCSTVAALISAGAAWFVMNSRYRLVLQQERAVLAVEQATFGERMLQQQQQIERLDAQLQQLGQEREELHGQIRLQSEAAIRFAAENRLLNTAVQELKNQYAVEQSLRIQAQSAVAHLDAERVQHQEKLDMLQSARAEMTLQFQNLANEILEEKSSRFTQQNQSSMDLILLPFKDRLNEFRSKVEEIHVRDTEQMILLRSELNQLKALNQQITQEAHELTTALKGQAKTQGNWGELILANVLERSGLQEGKDFRREVSFNTDEGKKRPDVIVYLPQNKHLVIDAKVSLNAYTRLVNAKTDTERQQFLQEHVAAVTSRIQELSDRAYHELPGLSTPDIVFMFIPMESAFIEALRGDETLFQKAVLKNVLVATPTTLLTSLSIVRQLWRFEEQNKHTAELADRAAKVYKKLLNFLDSMQETGAQLDRAKDSYNKALGQLCAGKGNLIVQAQKFAELGVAVQGNLPQALVAKAALELDTTIQMAIGSED